MNITQGYKTDLEVGEYNLDEIVLAVQGVDADWLEENDPYSDTNRMGE